MRNVLIAPDKFKHTLTALEAAKAMALGWQSAHKSDRIQLMPISDGGEGFGEALSREMGARQCTIKTVNAAHRRCNASWWYAPKTRTAIIESARIIGLAQLSAGKHHPFELDTFGLGAVLQAAQQKGALHCIVGIGGSATNDGGMGMAMALGWRFHDKDGKEITEWLQLRGLKYLIPPVKINLFKSLTVAVDVQNRLLGPKGCTRVYGPQKGLKSEDFIPAEAALKQLAAVVKKQLKLTTASCPGAGAAGGLGFGLMTFAHAKAVSGFDLFAQKSNLEKRLRKADLVLTGEGRIDDSTLMGKGVGELALKCRRHGIPCIGLAGELLASAKHQRLFQLIGSMTGIAEGADTRSNARLWLEKLAAHMAAEYKVQPPVSIP